MNITLFNPEDLREAFFRGAMIMEQLLELPYATTPEEFWDNEVAAKGFENFVDELHDEEED